MGRRDEFLEAVQDALVRVGETRDYSPAMEPDVTQAAAALLELFDTADEPDLDVGYPLGLLYWYRYIVLPEGPDRDALTTAVRLLTPIFMLGAAEIPPTLLPVLADNAVGAAVAVLRDATTSSDPRQLNFVVDVWTRIVDASSEDDPDRATRHANLGSARRLRFEGRGDPEDLDEAIAAYRRALAEAPANSETHTAILENLAFSFQIRADRFGVLEDLDQAIDAYRTLLSNGGGIAIKANLGTALNQRYESRGRLDDADEAIEVLRSVVADPDLPESDRAGVLSNLGNSLAVRFGRTGDRGALDDAVAVFGQALDLSAPDDRGRVTVLSNLALTARQQFENSRDPGALGVALAALREAAELVPPDHRDRAVVLANLGSCLRTEFERTGSLAVLDEAIEAGREAMRSTNADEPPHAAHIAELGSALLDRFSYLGATSDIDEVVENYRAAAAVTPRDHPDRAVILTNLGRALFLRYQYSEQLDDLDEAIESARSALADIPADDRVARARAQSNFGSALLTRFEVSGDWVHLRAALAAAREAVDLTPLEHVTRAGRLSNLGLTLHRAFQATGGLDVLDEAIAVGDEAVRLTPPGHPDLAGRLSNLATMHQDRATNSRQAAIEGYVGSFRTETASPAIRIHSARAAAALSADTDPSAAADQLEQAVLLLPILASRRLPYTGRLRALSEMSGLANDAAALMLSNPTLTPERRAERALTLLEAGRAVLLSQSFETRSDMTELDAAHPELAQRLTALRFSFETTDGQGPGAGDEAYRLAAEMDGLLASIRSLDGFEGFALPPSVADLLVQAVDGAIVMFNITSYRSDALLLTAEGIETIRLPQLTVESVVEHARAFHRALAAADDSQSQAETRTAAQSALAETAAWLWDHATGPVLDALGHKATPTGNDWPRVWWVPGGLLGLLPLHAAGHHNDDPADLTRRTVIDRVVSSYVPTIRSLRYARHHEAPSDEGSDSSLIVAMPTTPGLPDDGYLEHVTAEAEGLQALLPTPLVLIEPDSSRDLTAQQEDLPTRSRVFQELPHHGVVHFACRGMHDPTDPSGSRLLLHDHADAPLTVASLASINLRHARLAYLSACETALTTVAGLLDEAVHLTSAFQLAGFPHVIGTLWTIDDEIAVEIARDFYEELRDPESGRLDADTAAVALHHATRRQRDHYPHTLSLWAAHLHAGA